MKRLSENIKKRITDIQAFTLAEALVAIIILLLVSAIMVAGAPSAIRAYDNVVIASNAEVLLSTGMASLRNELGTAKDIASDNKNGDQGIRFFNEATGSTSRIFIQNNDSSNPDTSDIMLQRYAVDGVIVKESDLDDDLKKIYQKSIRLVSPEASDKDKKLHITYDSVDYNNGIVVFNNLRVLRKNGAETPAQVDTFSIRVITDN